MSDKLKYNAKTLSLINQLSSINKRIVIEKIEDDKIEINNRNISQSFAYLLTTHKDNFNFDGDNISFYDYSEFFKLFSVYDDVSIKQSDDNLVISKERSKLKFFLAEKEAILQDELPYIHFEESNASFDISSESLKKLKTLCSLIKATDVVFKVTEGKIYVTLIGEANQPEYEEEFDLNSGIEEDFEVQVEADIIKFAPENNYKIDLNEKGLIRFDYLNKDGIKLELYVAESEELS